MPEESQHNTFMGQAVPRYGLLKAVLSPADRVQLEVLREFMAANGVPDATDDDVVSFALYAAGKGSVMKTAALFTRLKGGKS